MSPSRNRRDRRVSRWSPLVTRLSKSGNPTISQTDRKRDSDASCSAKASTQALSKTSGCFIISVNDNFIVRMDFSFKMSRLLQNDFNSGVVRTDMNLLKKVDHMSLSADAIRIRDVPNAGGTSVISEVMSFEVLRKCFGASLLKTEMEVEYFPMGGSMVDYMVSISDTSLGVSVTRAMKYSGEFTEEDAMTLLNKKLNGIKQATMNAVERWSKQILHVWATTADVANLVTDIYETTIDENIKDNTVLIITIATTNANEIFFEKRPTVRLASG